MKFTILSSKNNLLFCYSVTPVEERVNNLSVSVSTVCHRSRKIHSTNNSTSCPKEFDIDGDSSEILYVNNYAFNIFCYLKRREVSVLTIVQLSYCICCYLPFLIFSYNPLVDSLL